MNKFKVGDIVKRTEGSLVLTVGEWYRVTDVVYNDIKVQGHDDLFMHCYFEPLLKKEVNEFRYCTPEQQGAILLAKYEGKRVEFQCDNGHWLVSQSKVVPRFRYRIAKGQPSTVNWNHVSKEFNCIGTDEDGTSWLGADMVWTGDWFNPSNRVGSVESTRALASFVQGNMDAEDSLIRRPIS